MEKISTCPVCGGNSLKTFGEFEDYFLTHETFHLSQCNQCSFVFTNPRPEVHDLGKYYQSDEYFSHSKTKKGLITFLYDVVKNYSLKKKYSLISAHKPKGKILDIGCATGEFLNYFKNNGWNCTGIEPAKDPRKYAIENFNLDVKAEEALDQLGPDTFDVITLWHVLEHVPNLNERLGQISKLLKPDGLLLIALPNHLSWDATYYKDFWAGFDVPRHLHHFSPDTVKLLLVKYNISIFDIKPMKFDAFYVSLLSEKYKTRSMKYLSAFCKGIKSNAAAKKNRNNYSSLIYLAKKQNA